MYTSHGNVKVIPSAAIPNLQNSNQFEKNIYKYLHLICYKVKPPHFTFWIQTLFFMNKQYYKLHVQKDTSVYIALFPHTRTNVRTVQILTFTKCKQITILFLTQI
jgi:hypothetical protein